MKNEQIAMIVEQQAMITTKEIAQGSILSLFEFTVLFAINS